MMALSVHTETIAIISKKTISQLGQGFMNKLFYFSGKPKQIEFSTLTHP